MTHFSQLDFLGVHSNSKKHLMNVLNLENYTIKIWMYKQTLCSSISNVLQFLITPKCWPIIPLFFTILYLFPIQPLNLEEVYHSIGLPNLHSKSTRQTKQFHVESWQLNLPFSCLISTELYLPNYIGKLHDKFYILFLVLFWFLNF